MDEHSPVALPFLQIRSPKKLVHSASVDLDMRNMRALPTTSFLPLIAGNLSGAGFGFGILFVEMKVSSSLSW